MRQFRNVEIRKQTRLFDDKFKVDELVVAHETIDGSMSRDQRRLIFERGDSAAVLIFNVDKKRVVLVDQFKAPTLGKGSGGGWITETVAGIIARYETPEGTAMREAMEETGYKIRDLTLISKFFSSPGGTSECVYLYYAEVRNADKVQKGGGKETEGEDIQVKEVTLAELFDGIRCNCYEDPKIIIGARWLAERLGSAGNGRLDYSSIKFELLKYPAHFLGYKTGPISDIKGVSLWVNSENEDMIMDRFIGRSISANIRFLGADRDEAGNLTEDLINNRLTAVVRRQSPMRIGTVIETESGTLSKTHDVDAILHVASVRGVGAGMGVKADLDDLARCTTNVLMKADERNKRYALLKRYGWIRSLFGWQISRSILIPMIGSGDGGLKSGHIAPKLFGAAVKYFDDNPDTTLQDVYFLSYTEAQKIACDEEIGRLQDHDALSRMPA